MEHIPAKKSLGQNFLHCGWALSAIIKATETTPNARIIEVGPGKGALTERLLEHGYHVTVIEKDDRLIPFLKEKFAAEEQKGTLTIIHGDALTMTMSSLIDHLHPWSIVANLPYYITGAFLRKIFEAEHVPTQVILMLQKEVVDRIIASDGKESLLSLSVKVYGTTKKVAVVPSNCFNPAPDVDSAILSVQNISKDFFTGMNEETFFSLLHIGFSQKRKQLARNIKDNTDISPADLDSIFKAISLNPKIRAEALTLSQWKNLYTHLHTKISTSSHSKDISENTK